MKTTRIINLSLIVFFSAIFSTSFIPERVLDHSIIAIRNTYFTLSISAFCIGLIILYLVRNRKGPIYYNALDVFITSYFLFVFSNYMLRGIPVNDVFISFISLLFFYFFTRQIMARKNDSTNKLIIIIFLLIGFFQGMQGFFQLIGITLPLNNIFKVTGSFLNPAPYTVYLISFLAFSLSVFFFTKTDSWLDYVLKYVAIANVIIITVVLPQTESRTSWIAGAVGVSVVFFIKHQVGDTLLEWLTVTRNRILTSIIIVCILVSAVLLYKFKEDSVHGRLFIWKVAVKMIPENPMVGNGFNGVRRSYNNAQSDYFKNSPDNFDEIRTSNQVSYLFNDYLQIVVEEGAIGFSIFLLLLLVCIFLGIKITKSLNVPSLNKSLVVGSLSALISLSATFVSMYSLETLPTAINFFFFMAIISAVTPSRAISFSGNQIKKYVAYGFIMILTVISLIVIRIELKSYSGYLNVTDRYSNADHLQVLKDNYSTLKNDPAYTLAYGKALATKTEHQKSIEVLNLTSRYLCDTSLYRSLGDSYRALGDYNEAEKSYLKLIHIAPQRFTPRYHLVKLYLENQDTIKALSMAQYTVNLPVKINSVVIDKMKIEMQKLLDKKP